MFKYKILSSLSGITLWMSHFKPNITVTDLCFPKPLPSLIKQKCWDPCHSLKLNNINITLCVTCPLTSGCRSFYQSLKIFLPIPTVQSTSLYIHTAFHSGLNKCTHVQIMPNAVTNTPSPLFAAAPSHHTALTDTASSNPGITHLPISGTIYWQH